MRIAPMIKQGTPYTKVNPVEVLGRDKALVIYGLGKQGRFGNVTGEAPTFLWDPKGNYKWYAWKKVEGMPKDVAKAKFLVKAEALLD